MHITHALRQIAQAGFTLAVDGPDIIVNPPGKLSPEQKQFIRDHKREIIATLLESSQAGSDIPSSNDHQAEPFVTIEQLPGRLIDAATRLCSELYGDGPEQVQSMVEDLCWNRPEDWGALIEHFEGQLSSRSISPSVTCESCRHAVPTIHPAIVNCAAGVESGANTGGWWKYDLHLCDEREVRP